MAYTAGDRVHVAGLGTGVIRELRGEDRLAVEIKNRLVIVLRRDVEPVADTHVSRRRRDTVAAPAASPSDTQDVLSLDLHGKTVAESVDLVAAFIDEALRAGHHRARVIHGRSGGKVKMAVHRYLSGVSVVRAFRIDPRNAGVTIILF